MNMLMIILVIFVIAVIAVSLALFWHWKTYMPERRHGAGIFLIYTIGLVALFMALYSTLSQ